VILHVRAPAKVNLALEVLDRRADGYHDLASVVHAVALADEIEVRPAARLRARTVEAQVPAEADLVRRAARLLKARAGVPGGAEVVCRKRIPVASGLGGGSADAAATLRLLARAWGVGAPDLLRTLAAELGSDVPMFLVRGAALVEGRGERVTALPPLRGVWAVLVPQAGSLLDKTRRLFGALRPECFTDGARAVAAAEALRRGRVPGEDALWNAFDDAARALHPGLAERWRALEAHTGRRFHLSGAGPSLFALVRDRREGAALCAGARGAASSAILARLVPAALPIRAGMGGTDLARETE
jgi:4-diphosphocytidyl-2-C-methyl-D-erythritol kinase